MSLGTKFTQTLLQTTGASHPGEPELIQSLWEGYGTLMRYYPKGGRFPSIVVKHVRLPRKTNKDIGHLRKIRSYEVETTFYKHFSIHTTKDCRIPACIGTDALGDEVLLVLEDLDTAGFYARRSRVSWKEIESCVRWLANFHGVFMHEKPSNLWKIGTYWHLATRPDELEVLRDKALKAAAPAIDAKLNNAQFKTFVHGDAKLQNFCFTKDGCDVAAVDFQYVGGGCGMKDLAYFMDSCLNSNDCERYEAQILQTYFLHLKQALDKRSLQIDFAALEQEWRTLYPLAWADFYRFLKGWSREYWSGTAYSEKLCKYALQQLQ